VSEGRKIIVSRNSPPLIDLVRIRLDAERVRYSVLTE